MSWIGPAWRGITFLRLCKWNQIAQRTTYIQNMLLIFGEWSNNHRIPHHNFAHETTMNERRGMIGRTSKCSSDIELVFRKQLAELWYYFTGYILKYSFCNCSWHFIISFLGLMEIEKVSKYLKNCPLAQLFGTQY